jgi:HD-GYP domain-containing protein (c-di-GMP phosphodiesterase class II)
MDKLTLSQLAIPMIKSIDSFNYLLKSHHRRVAIISYHLGKALKLSDDALLQLVIAAALHDIGALSIQERDMLIQEDVVNPTPHCLMGYKMLAPFEVFDPIAHIIKYHHINYQDSLLMSPDEVSFQSFIIHLADRVDVLLNPDSFILTQKELVSEKIASKAGTVFHPEVYAAFQLASRSDIFWIDIDNVSMEQLFNKLNFTFDVEMSYEDILEFSLTLSRIVDFRSRFTVSHSYTVAQLAEFIGQIFNYSQQQCNKLKIAGYLHDIGKIGIDPHILNKDGPLTDEEFQMMKLHPYFTEQILTELKNNDWLKESVAWAAQHHEKTDGSGYPHGLSGDEIFEGSKIVAFADVIAALMEDRPYRDGMSSAEAFERIRDSIAPEISAEMFSEIDKHQTAIDVLVSDCKQYSSAEFNKGISH